jgi:hypothetical protein
MWLPLQGKNPVDRRQRMGMWSRGTYENEHWTDTRAGKQSPAGREPITRSRQ